MIERLLIGTGNPTKLRFFKKFLSDLPIKLLTLKDLRISEEPEESGSSIEENAEIKARYYYEKSGMPVLVDDGGFEIPALNNFPGTHTHRFNGRLMNDEEVIQGIIEKMKGLTGEERKARFRAVVVLMLAPDKIYQAEGNIEGIVPEAPLEKRISHFPYRSLLYITNLKKWFYDLTDEEEERLGYRKSAVNELKKYLV